MVTASAHETLTPLSSVTNSAPFVMEEGKRVALSSGSHATSGALHKLRTKTSLQDIPEGRSVRAESNQSTQSTAPGQWGARFGGYTGGGDVALVVCCPCFPAARLHSLLGGSFESGVIYFGGLVFGMLLLLGLSNSNTSSPSTGSTAEAAALRSHPPATSGGDKFVAQDADPTTRAPLATAPSHALLYAQCAAALLVLFLLGVAYLRTKTRLRFNIPGSRALDCLLSAACCWCVLSQARAHAEKHNRFELGLDTPTDTLPAYT
ncbi:hypothetical protein PybrP1_010609 [[Pythium] brassicae (nom. inval.)]|nr:hypothetical protein PybrP1_010609 [[Pythium] brassicae (nom. inval.)]